jgi:histidinol-phosphate aminotransferase
MTPLSPGLAAPLPPRLAAFIRQDVRGMHAYAVQPSTGLVKLDAMENPHRLPEALRVELGRRLGAVALNRYPGARIDVLRAALARHAGMPDGFALMLGNGSDELISLLAMVCDVPAAQAVRHRPAAVLAPVPGFVMYEMSARLQGLHFVGVPLAADFELDEPAMLAAVREHRPALTYLAYPNNPTANLWDADVVERIVEAVAENGGFVVMDEAYQPFASRSYLDRLTRHDHVLLMRTLSKFGLAGVRIGYLMGPAALIAEIDKVRPPYNVSVLNCEAALFALEHEDEFAHQATLLRSERSRLVATLSEMPGATPFPSEANMVLVRVPDAASAFEGLKARGVLVKNVSSLHPLLADCLRLTVGLPEENDRMIAALKGCLA